MHDFVSISVSTIYMYTYVVSGKKITGVASGKVITKLVNILQGHKLEVMRLWSPPDRNCPLPIYKLTSNFTQSGTLS